MEYRNLKIAKDILFNTFWIGYVFVIVFWFLYLLIKPMQETMMAQWHLGNPEFVEILTISFFGLAKFTLIWFALVPALAIRWTLRKLEKKRS